MTVQDMFEIGEIMEDEDKAKSIASLNEENCKITTKALNKNKIILHMKRDEDGSEGNVFVRLKDEFSSEFLTSKKLFASKKIAGLSLAELRKMEIEAL